MDKNLEVIEWDFSNIDKNRIRTSKEEVLEQVLSGLESVNQSLGTNYKLSQKDNSSLEAQKEEFIQQGVPKKNIRFEVGSAADPLK